MVIFKPINSVYRLIKNNSQDIFGFERKYSFPNPISFFLKIKKAKPDLVIIRERTFLCIMTNIICAILRIKIILYNQSPLHVSRRKISFASNIFRKLVYSITPRYRITPVLGDVKETRDKNSYYIPFVIKTNPIMKNTPD